MEGETVKIVLPPRFVEALIWYYHPSAAGRRVVLFAIAMVILLLLLFAAFYMTMHRGSDIDSCKKECHKSCSSGSCKWCKSSCDHMCTGVSGSIRALYAAMILLVIFALVSMLVFFFGPRHVPASSLVAEVAFSAPSTGLVEEAPATASNLVGSAATPASPLLEGQ
ncbi:palmitoyltransferase ZDHHC19, putative [Babesia caballi]|uniref:Palmitoyltransferase ZDHHC19, putative n=1 Tax=Babesia caballi TaxID=5871 RepID=A0AAV4LLP8_BABCB|nr:palmitoyltransferase ZDHHC19, putative [Babesia caballi]